MQLISFLAGLGLFFSGLHFLSASMQPIFSGKLRDLLINSIRGPFSSALAGTLIGAIAQSSNAANFIGIGLLNSGAVSFNQALSLVAWSGAGTAVLVFLVSINIKLFSFFCLAIVGLMYLFNISKDVKYKHIIALLFAFGLVLFGLGLIKEGGSFLKSSAWAREFFIFASESQLISLLIGIVIALIFQSSASVAILAVTLNLTGALNLNEAIILVLGANIGSGLSILFFSSHLEGQKKQIAIYCFLSKLLGSMLFYPLLWFNLSKNGHFFNTDIIGPSLFLSMVYLNIQLMGAAFTSVFQKKIILLLNFFSPHSEEDNLFKFHYISSDLIDNTETAIVLVSKEQNRMIKSLVDYLEPIRIEHEQSSNIKLNIRHELTLDLFNKIKLLISETASRNQSDKNNENLFKIQRKNEDVISLINELYNFEKNIEAIKDHKKGLANSMVESLHLILTLLTDFLEPNADGDDLLGELTSDRSQLMENIRNSLISDHQVSLEERQMLFISTSQFERITWLIRRIYTTKLV